MKLIPLLKKEAVLFIAAFFALLSVCFIPPDLHYFSYIDYSVLAILFCLMAVVAGFKKLGLFDILSQKLLGRTKSVKSLTFLLVNCVFVCSMLVTNDVSLIAFVPVTIGIFASAKREKLIFVIVMETLAANLGSMLTPIGNPQNLYIYSFYKMDILNFFRFVLPVGAVSYIILTGIMLASKKDSINITFEQKAAPLKLAPFLVYTGLFVLCILAVLRIVDYRICILVVLCVVLILDRKLLAKVDYGLLLTFFCFFIFTGNLERIGLVKNALSSFLEGRVFITGILTSQVISNVPAAMMISGFTSDVRNLLLGVNIGGLGTPVASLASLISFRLYSRSENSSPGKFLAVFSVYNILILVALALIFIFIK
ncbi:MAG: SLC13 family permease [Treponema sp.]|nr:SLC13 family permease [Treponema sp.]